jgi:hypothetical protein
VRAGDLAPDDPDVGTTDLTLGPVDESDLLSEVEVGGLSVVNTVDLDQTVNFVRNPCSSHTFDVSRDSDRYLVFGLTARFERW